MSKAKEVIKKYKVELQPTEAASEEFDVQKAISSLIDTNFSGSDEEQGKASQLMKGLFFSDDPNAKKFIKALDKATSSMNPGDFS